MWTRERGTGARSPWWLCRRTEAAVDPARAGSTGLASVGDLQPDGVVGRLVVQVRGALVDLQGDLVAAAAQHSTVEGDVPPEHLSTTATAVGRATGVVWLERPGERGLVHLDGQVALLRRHRQRSTHGPGGQPDRECHLRLWGRGARQVEENPPGALLRGHVQPVGGGLTLAGHLELDLGAPTGERDYQA